MSKLNFVQPPPAPDVGGPPGWFLLLVADVMIMIFAGLMLLRAAH